ncbi:MAG: hypothetical protein DRP08_03290 [Candidatus Aenigmatarchaeota archaeon]|nr:MAG: hypothetical protein DRP08_03290 [Candidatus Aenigmarchaeota archaeon]
MRYFKEVHMVELGRMSPKEFVETIYGPDFDWAEAWAAARIYVEDGGKRYTPIEFVAACGVEEPPEVKGKVEDFVKE